MKPRGLRGPAAVRPPLSLRDYWLAANQRFAAAEYLHRGKSNLEAAYLGGYTIECSLKALILAIVDPGDRLAVAIKIRGGKVWHDYRRLLEELAGRGIYLPVPLKKRLTNSTWSTDLRYDSGTVDHGETRGFLKLAAQVLAWIEGEIKRVAPDDQSRD